MIKKDIHLLVDKKILLYTFLTSEALAAETMLETIWSECEII